MNPLKHPPHSPAPSWRDAGLILLIAAIYFVAARFGLSYASVHPSASALWPPTGIALAAFLVLGNRVWLGIAAGAFAVNWLTSGSPASSAGIALGNTLEGLAGAWLIRRFAGGLEVFTTPGNLFRFVVLGAGLSTMVSATIGVASLALDGLAPWPRYSEIWTTWWLGDAMGNLIVAPPLLLWLTGKPPVRPRRPIPALAALALFVITGAIFFGDLGLDDAPIAWFWLPPVVWIAYHFGQRAAATTILVMSAVLIAATSRNVGPFVLPSPNASLLLLQAYMAVASILALTLSAVVAARKQTVVELERTRDELEIRVRERTAELSRTNDALRAEIGERLRLSQELIHAGEHERRRLGWDLHDDLGQLLTGISYLSSAVQSKLAARSQDESQKVREIGSLVEEAIIKTRRLSLGLNPVSLGTGGLMTAIRELAEMTQRVFDVACVVEYDERLIVERPVAATNLYRVAQEAISNAVRHGRARHLKLTVKPHAGGALLSVADDGVGIGDRNEERAGLGLSIMKYRAEMIGGTLRVESNEDGTTVTCILPGLARLMHQPDGAEG